jgi:hypothetical protein
LWFAIPYSQAIADCRPGAEPSPRHDRRRKRLGRQVGRGLGIMRATRGEREQLASVAVIELAESPGWLRAGTLNR